MTKRSMRRLKFGDPIPEGEPQRYQASNGYIVLRWKLGPYEYVEVLEHRLIAGMEKVAVHHINRVKNDNRHENLESVTHAEHGVRHMTTDVQKAARMYAEGLALPEIAKSLGSHTGNLSRHLRRIGVVMRPKRKPRHPVDYERVRALFNEGQGRRQIAISIGVKTGPVLRAMKEMGLKRPCGRVPIHQQTPCHSGKHARRPDVATV